MLIHLLFDSERQLKGGAGGTFNMKLFVKEPFINLFKPCCFCGLRSETNTLTWTPQLCFIVR